MNKIGIVLIISTIMFIVIFATPFLISFISQFLSATSRVYGFKFRPADIHESNFYLQQRYGDPNFKLSESKLIPQITKDDLKRLTKYRRNDTPSSSKAKTRKNMIQVSTSSNPKANYSKLLIIVEPIHDDNKGVKNKDPYKNDIVTVTTKNSSETTTHLQNFIINPNYSNTQPVERHNGNNNDDVDVKTLNTNPLDMLNMPLNTQNMGVEQEQMPSLSSLGNTNLIGSHPQPSSGDPNSNVFEMPLNSKDNTVSGIDNQHTSIKSDVYSIFPHLKASNILPLESPDFGIAAHQEPKGLKDFRSHLMNSNDGHYDQYEDNDDFSMRYFGGKNLDRGGNQDGPVNFDIPTIMEMEDSYAQHNNERQNNNLSPYYHGVGRGFDEDRTNSRQMREGNYLRTFDYAPDEYPTGPEDSKFYVDSQFDTDRDFDFYNDQKIAYNNPKRRHRHKARNKLRKNSYPHNYNDERMIEEAVRAFKRLNSHKRGYKKPFHGHNNNKKRNPDTTTDKSHDDDKNNYNVDDSNVDYSNPNFAQAPSSPNHNFGGSDREKENIYPSIEWEDGMDRNKPKDYNDFKPSKPYNADNNNEREADEQQHQQSDDDYVEGKVLREMGRDWMPVDTTTNEEDSPKMRKKAFYNNDNERDKDYAYHYYPPKRRNSIVRKNKKQKTYNEKSDAFGDTYPFYYKGAAIPVNANDGYGGQRKGFEPSYENYHTNIRKKQNNINKFRSFEKIYQKSRRLKGKQPNGVRKKGRIEEPLHDGDENLHHLINFLKRKWNENKNYELKNGNTQVGSKLDDSYLRDIEIMCSVPQYQHLTECRYLEQLQPEDQNNFFMDLGKNEDRREDRISKPKQLKKNNIFNPEKDVKKSWKYLWDDLNNPTPKNKPDPAEPQDLWITSKAMVTCDNIRYLMDVEFDFIKPFTGVVYILGHFKDDKCRLTGDGSMHVTFTFSLRECGTNENLLDDNLVGQPLSEFQNKIVVMKEGQHGILDYGDKIYEVKCTTHSTNKAIYDRSRSIEYGLDIKEKEPITKSPTFRYRSGNMRSEENDIDNVVPTLGKQDATNRVVLVKPYITNLNFQGHRPHHPMLKHKQNINELRDHVSIFIINAAALNNKDSLYKNSFRENLLREQNFFFKDGDHITLIGKYVGPIFEDLVVNDILLTHCYASPGDHRNKIQIIDKNGCQLYGDSRKQNHDLFQNKRLNEKNIFTYANLTNLNFDPDTKKLNIFCGLTLCETECDRQICEK